MIQGFYNGIPSEGRDRLGLDSMESNALEGAKRRTRRMTLRGRITLGVLPLVLVGFGYFFQLNDSRTSDQAMLPSVDAAPPATVPQSILRRVPAVERLLNGIQSTAPSGHLVEYVTIPEESPADPMRIEYTLDVELSKRVEKILKRGRVRLGHVIVTDPKSGRVLAYASTDRAQFPPDQTYPAASLIKVVTSAAAIRHAPEAVRRECRYRGSPYRLTPSRIDPPDHGRTMSFQRALATSNNQCFAQLAVHDIGSEAMVDTIRDFGFLDAPAAGHLAGEIDLGDSAYDLGRLGCGLSGLRITPMHAVQLAMTLSDGVLREPYWIERVVDGNGKERVLPRRPLPKRVLTSDQASRIRAMMVDTTRQGTARKAFRLRNGRYLLDPVRVAGKTGSLSGKNPTGRYEWFVGVAPAEAPEVAVAVLLVQNDLWFQNSSQVAAEVLRQMFCPQGVCDVEAVKRWLAPEDERQLAEAMPKVVAANPVPGRTSALP